MTRKRIIGTALLAVFWLALTACREEAPRMSIPEEEVAVGGYYSEVYAKKVSIGGHKYHVVYATCNGWPGHSVRECNDSHCFLLHSQDCPCRAAQMSAVEVDADDTESEDADPFKW